MLGAPVLLPGKLFAVTDVSRSGFLAFTESVSTEATPAGKDPKTGTAIYSTSATPTRQVQANLVADSQASLISSIPIGLDAKLTAQGRNVYSSAAGKIDRYTLSDAASFTNTGSATTDWTPSEIQMRGTSLVGAYGKQLMRVSWPGLEGVVENFVSSQWFELTRLTLWPDGSLIVPMGDYGVEKLTDVTLSGTTNRTVSLVSTSAGMLTLSGSNTGTVTLTDSIANSGSIGINAGTLTFSGSNTYSGTANQTGSVVSTSGGTLILAGSNVGTVTLSGSNAPVQETYTGTTGVNQGTLTLTSGSVRLNGL